MSVIEKTTSRPGYIRFETNRSFTGMGHESYLSSEEVFGDRPPDNLARKLFETEKVDQVHVYAQAVTVKIADGKTSEGIKELLEDLYTFYRPGVEVPTVDSFK